jgi:O-antigen ligase
MHVQAIGVPLPLQRRELGLELASQRWARLAAFGAYGFVAMLYASPTHWWPVFESFRLSLATAAICAGAVVMHRLTSGERLRAGGAAAGFLYAYAAAIPLSMLWTVHPPSTERAIFDVAKLVVVFVAIQSAIDSRARLRTLFAVGAIASIAPALGSIRIWRAGENLVEGYRTHWYGVFADPNRLAMNLVLVLPMTLALAGLARRTWVKIAFGAIAGAQLVSIVLTHSRSGAVATALATTAYLLRGDLRRVARGVALALVLLAGVAAFAPATFWQRSASVAQLQEDASVYGRERSWRVLAVIFDERPLTGVGAGAYLEAWPKFAPLSASGRRLIAHNVFMEILGELGIIALLSFFAFVAILLARLWIAGRDEKGGLEARVVFASLAGYMLMELVNGYSLSWWLYLLFACACSAIRIQRRHGELAAAGEGVA